MNIANKLTAVYSVGIKSGIPISCHMPMIFGQFVAVHMVALRVVMAIDLELRESRPPEPRTLKGLGFQF